MDLSHAEDFYIRKLFEKAKIMEIMRTDVVKIYNTDTLSRAEETFVTTGVSHLLVVDKDNKLTGLITPKYLYKTISPSKFISPRIEGDIRQGTQTIIDGNTYYSREELDSIRVTDIMKYDPFTLKPENTVGEGILNMGKRNISCIPILNDKYELIGVFTNQEIINFLSRILTE